MLARSPNIQLLEVVSKSIKTNGYISAIIDEHNRLMLIVCFKVIFNNYPKTFTVIYMRYYIAAIIVAYYWFTAIVGLQKCSLIKKREKNETSLNHEISNAISCAIYVPSETLESSEYRNISIIIILYHWSWPPNMLYYIFIFYFSNLWLVIHMWLFVIAKPLFEISDINCRKIIQTRR